MPFRRRTYSKRPKFTRKRSSRSYKKRQPSVSFARKIVQRGAETKRLVYLWQDTMNTDTTTDHTSCVKYHDPLNVAQGNQRNERDGAKIFGKSVAVNLAFTPSTNATDCFVVRLTLVKIHQTNPLTFGATPAAANYENMYWTSGFIDAYPSTTKLGLCQYPNRNSYSVVGSKTFSVAGRSNSNNQRYPNVVHMRHNFKLNRTITYKTGTVQSNETYLLLIHLINADNHADTNVLSFSGYTEFIFKDF